MPQVCILTDSTAQFIKPNFPGSELVHVVPLTAIEPDASSSAPQEVAFPGMESLRQQFQRIGNEYNEIVAILLSARLHPKFYHTFQQAAETMRGKLSIQVIDSLNTAISLGYLVQQAAQAASNGANSTEINRMLQTQIQHVYTVFCTRNLRYLAECGSIDKSHAVIGEMLGLAPIFVFENGRLMASHKARNARHLVDLFQEFVDEFFNLKHIAILKGVPVFSNEVSQMRDRLQNLQPRVPFSEHALGNPLGTMLGARSLGLAIIES